jgi:hypothetical protein
MPASDLLLQRQASIQHEKLCDAFGSGILSDGM